MPSYTKAKQLFQAVDQGNNLNVERLIASGASGKDCGPALIRAAYRGNEYAARRLVEAGADVRCGGDRPFRVAVTFGRVAIAELFFAAGITFETLPFHPLSVALDRAQTEIIKWLFLKGLQLKEYRKILIQESVEEASIVADGFDGVSTRQRQACINLLLRQALEEPLSHAEAKAIAEIVAQYAPCKVMAATWLAEFIVKSQQQDCNRGAGA